MYEDLRTQIFVFLYKDSPVLKNDDIYIPVMAGNALQRSSHYKGDDSGIHISCKNKFYSELTGIYWVWKNTNQDIVGSMHYRRFLTCQIEPLIYQIRRLLYFPLNLHKKRYGIIYTREYKKFCPLILSRSEILEFLHDYDAIMPLRRLLRHSVREHYRRYHNIRDLEIISLILKEKYPEYLSSFELFLSGNRMYANNMFIFKRADFDRCMSWLFSVLFELENRIQLDNYQGYQRRICGFMGERLLNVWLLHHRLKIKELSVVYFKHLKNHKPDS